MSVADAAGRLGATTARIRRRAIPTTIVGHQRKSPECDLQPGTGSQSPSHCALSDRREQPPPRDRLPPSFSDAGAIVAKASASALAASGERVRDFPGSVNTPLGAFRALRQVFRSSTAADAPTVTQMSLMMTTPKIPIGIFVKLQP